jgi:hypothetical protein
MKCEVHIAFHYRWERIPILEKTVSLIREWEDETCIFIHTNNKDFIFPNATICVWEDLTHPYILTLVPVEYIKSHELKSDVYVYTEDDIGISKESYAYWKRYQNTQLGFIRYSGEYLCDLNHIPNVTDTLVVFKELYKGFWINTKEQMIMYMSEIDFLKRSISQNMEWSRERCAFGNTFGTCFIPISELRYAFVEHIGYEKTAKELHENENVNLCKFTFKRLNSIIENADSRK